MRNQRVSGEIRSIKKAADGSWINILANKPYKRQSFPPPIFVLPKPRRAEPPVLAWKIIFAKQRPEIATRLALYSFEKKEQFNDES